MRHCTEPGREVDLLSDHVVGIMGIGQRCSHVQPNLDLERAQRSSDWLLCMAALHTQRPAGGLARIGEDQQEAIAHVLDEPAPCGLKTGHDPPPMGGSDGGNIGPVPRFDVVSGQQRLDGGRLDQVGEDDADKVHGHAETATGFQCVPTWKSERPRYEVDLGFTTHTADSVVKKVRMLTMSQWNFAPSDRSGGGEPPQELPAGAPCLVSGGLTVATSNPAFSRDLFPGYEQVYGGSPSTTMTVQGTVYKTFVLLAILLATGAWAWNAAAAQTLGYRFAGCCRHRRFHRGDGHDLLSPSSRPGLRRFMRRARGSCSGPSRKSSSDDSGRGSRFRPSR